MADPILCLKCRRPVRAEAEFCPSCGQRLKKRCVSTTCDAVLSFADTHCYKCGTPQGASLLTPQLAGEAMKAAPDLVKGGLGCLKDFIMLIGIPGVIVIVVLWVINSLTGGWIFNLLFGWIWAKLAPWIVLAVVGYGLFLAYKRRWFQKLIEIIEAKGREDRAGYLVQQARQQARKVEEQRQAGERKRQKAVARRRQEAERRAQPRQPGFFKRLASWRIGKRVVSPPPPPERLEQPPQPAPRRATRRAPAAPVAPPAPAFDQAVVEAQVRRVALRPGYNRARAELVVRVAIGECGTDTSPAALKKAVDDVLLRQA